MLFFIVNIALTLSQLCPNVFFLSNIPETTNLIAYNEDFNYLIAAQQDSLMFLQAESGTLRQVKLTQQYSYMITEGTNLYVGGINEVLIYTLDEENQLINSLSLLGTVTTIQVINSLVSVGTNNYLSVLWDPTTNQVIGRIKSLQIQNIQITHQILNQGTYDTIIIGTNSGNTYLEYYTQNMQQLLISQSITGGSNIDIISSISSNTITAYVYIATTQLLIYQVVKQTSVSITQQNSITLPYNTIQLYAYQNYIALFYDNCYYQEYNNQLQNLIQWNTNCPSISQLVFSISDQLIIMLLSGVTTGNEIIQIYQFDSTTTANQVRSFFYITGQISQSYILSSNYILVVGTLTSNILIYNQWYQLQQTISVGSSYPAVQIIQSTLILILYSNGLIVSLSEVSTSCQFSQFTCNTYSIATTQTNTPGTTTQSFAIFTYNSVIYVIYVADTQYTIYSYISNTFTQTNQQSVSSNILQIIIDTTNSNILFLQDNNQLITYPFSIATSAQSSTYTMTFSIQNVNQETQNSLYYFAANSQTLEIYSILSPASPAATISQLGVNFKQIYAYSDKLIVLEQNSYNLYFYLVSDLLNQNLSAVYTLQIPQYCEQFTINGNNVILQFSNYIMILLMQNFFTQSTSTSCQFTQTFTSGVDSFISVQMSLQNIYILYQSLNQLVQIQGTINIQKQNMVWSQAFINQDVNQYVDLQLIGVSTSQSSIIIDTSITNLLSISFTQLTLIIPSCLLTLTSTGTSSFSNVNMIKSTSTTTQCVYFSLNSLQSFTLSSISISSLTFTQQMITSIQVGLIILDSITITNSDLSQLVTITSETTLQLNSVTITQSQCNSQLTLKQLFQYFSLTINQFLFQSNTICCSLFNNLISDSSDTQSINIQNMNIESNSFNQYSNSAILTQQSSNIQKTTQVILSTITFLSNTYSTTNDIIYSLYFGRGSTISVNSLAMDGSAIAIYNYQELNINSIQFSNINQLCIEIKETPSITLSDSNFISGNINAYGVISIMNQLEYDCLVNANLCIIQLTNIDFQNINLISNSIVNTCYAIQIELKDEYTVSLSQIVMQTMEFKSTQQQFIASSAGIYIIAYQSAIIIRSSIFNNNLYSLSTSILILNVFSINIEYNTIYMITPLDNLYYGMQSEMGGFAQIAASTIQIASNSVNQLTSYGGSILYIQMFTTNGVVANINIISNNFTNIYTYSSGAIYLVNMLENQQTNINNNLFGNIFSLSDGGIFYFQKEQSTTYPTLNLSNINPNNITTLQSSYQFTKYVIFSGNQFYNIYSTNGSIVTGSLFQLKFYNNLFQYNSITSKPNQFINNTISQGALIQLIYCDLIVQNFTVKYINSFAGQPYSGQILNAYETWMSLQQLTIQSTTLTQQELIFLTNCYVYCDDLYIYSISIQSVKTNQNLIELYNSSIYLTNATITNSICNSNTCMSSGIYLKQTNSKIVGGNYYNNIGNLGSVFYFSLEEQFGFIDSILAYSNYANTFGGVILIDAQNVSTISITNCQFSYNTAVDSGGAIYINSIKQQFLLNETQDLPVITISNTNFFNNTAYKYGGAIKTLVFCPEYTNINYSDNIAYLEGNDVSSYPSSLFLEQPLENQSPNDYVYNKNLDPLEGYQFTPYASNGRYFLLNFKSGDSVEQTLYFIMKSSDNRTMYNDQAILKIWNTDISEYSMTTENGQSIQQYNGSFQLIDTTIIGTPDSQFQFFLTSDEIKNTDNYNYYYSNNYNYTFTVDFRSCYYGEILQDYNNQTICYQCPSGFYSFDLPTIQDPGQCQVCPLITTYHIVCNGGAQTSLEPYYWRENITTLVIYSCDTTLSDCEGGVFYDQCGIGYTGRMCQVCEYNLNYARDTREQCIICTSVDWPITIILLTSIGILLYFLLSIFFLAQDVVILCLLPCLNQLLPPLKKIGTNLGQVKDLNSLMKIFLSYYQKISLVTKIVTDIPAQFVDSQDPSIFDFSLECPLINVNNYIPMVYVNYIIEVLKPVSSMLLFMFCWTILFRNQKIKRGIYYTATWLVIWLFYLPTFYEKTLQLMNCETIGDQRYLKSDLNQECYGTVHLFYTLFITIPCLLFFVVYIPLMLLYHIRNDMHKKDKRPLRKYKYYYINGEFREKFYYWEFVRLLEKILIQTCIEVFFYNTIYMAEACMIIVLIYGVASFVAQPYGYKRQNFVNVISSFTAFATIYISLIIATLNNTLEDPTGAPIIIFFEVILAMINIIYALWMGWKLFKVMLPVLFVNIEQIQRKVADVKYLRQMFLGERLRARLLFKQLGQKVIVINLVKKHAMLRYMKQEQIDEQMNQIEDKIRQRKQTAAHEALYQILRTDVEQRRLTALKQIDETNHENDINYVELPEQQYKQPPL